MVPKAGSISSFELGLSRFALVRADIYITYTQLIWQCEAMWHFTYYFFTVLLLLLNLHDELIELEISILESDIYSTSSSGVRILVSN